MLELLIVLILILGLLNLCADIIILRAIVDDCDDVLNIENEEKGGLFNMKWGVRKDISGKEKVRDDLNSVCDTEKSDEGRDKDAAYLAFVREQIHALETDKFFGRISEEEYQKFLADIANDISNMEKKYCIV